MAKATDNTRVGGRHTAWAEVTVPKSRALYELLQGTGRVTGAAAERVLNAIAVRADPGDSSTKVMLLATPARPGHPSDADVAVSGLTALLAKARAEGHEAAELVAVLAAQLGYREPAPQPAPVPAPAPAPAPAGAPQ